MATRSGNIFAGSSVASGYKFATPKKTDIILSGSEYPSGIVTISGGAWYLGYGSTTTSYPYDIYLCDSSGNNTAKIGTLSINGQSTKNNVTISSSSSLSQTGLAGKQLYIKATGSNVDNLTFMNTLSVTVNTTESYSASTFSASDVYFGSASKVTFSNPYITELRHTVTWSIPDTNFSHSETTSTGATNVSYTIPQSWMNGTTSSTTSVTLRIEVQTKKGSSNIGSSSAKNYKVKVPETSVPTLGSITVAVNGSPNAYIKGKTGATITFNNVAPADSYSTVPVNNAHYVLSCNKSENYTRSGNVYTISTLSNSGNIQFSAYVVDSRGRKSTTKTQTITVSDYSVPVISSTNVYRCLQNGTADDNGTYLSIKCSATCSNITGNSLTINSYYYLESTPDQHITAQNNMTSGQTYIIGNGNIDPSYTYHVVFTATDTIGGEKTKDVKVSTAAYSIHVKNQGNGVAFGKTSEISNSVEINPDWDLYYKGSPINGIISKDTMLYQGTASTSHTFTVPSASRNFIIIAGSSSTRTWIGYVYANNSGTVTLMPAIVGTNTTASSGTNAMTFAFDDSVTVFVRVFNISGDTPYIPTP